MKKVIFGIGIPGSGKTTALKQLLEEHPDFVYICPDDIRAELCGNTLDQSRNAEVWRTAFEKLIDAMQTGDETTVVFDSTQARSSDRKAFVRKCRDWGNADIVEGWYFDVPIETAIARNDLRDRQVPLYVIERMYEDLMQNPPTTDEGIDALYIINDEGIIPTIEGKNRANEGNTGHGGEFGY